jgi:hypothetical protein
MQVDVAVVRNAIARVSGHAPHHVPQGGQRSGSSHLQMPSHSTSYAQPQHPNAPPSASPDGSSAGPATLPRLSPPPTDEVEVIALLADHPHLIATAEADKAFWLLTDDRLRAMYSAVREGQSFLELAQVQLPPTTAAHVLSGKYSEAKDPRAALIAMATNLDHRKSEVGLAELKKRMGEAHRSGDRDLARRLAQLAEAERKGDHELVARIKDSLVASNRKQVE